VFPLSTLNYYEEVRMIYKKLLSVTVFTFMLLTSTSLSQEAVLTLVPFNGDTATFINWQIIADTTATNGLLPNRVYELQRDAIYLHNRVFTVLNGQTLRLRAQSGTGKKPIVYLWESGTGGTPTRPPGNMFVLNGGHLFMKDICVAGYYEPEPDRVDGVQGGLIQTSAVGSSIILDGVILSNTNGNHVRTNQNVTKVVVTNSIFANMGALTTSNLGAGKGFDLREATCDTFVIVNNTFVNYQDRAIRHYNFANPTAGTGAIKYGVINHNTFINGMGYHGLLSLGDVGNHMQITNNLFVDGFALGEDSTDNSRAAEWANTGEFYANGNNRIMWIFSAPNDSTNWVISNNYYTITSEGQAWLDDNHFGLGAFGPASPLSWHINSRLGTDSATAFIKENGLTLVNKPNLMTNMMTWYVNPAGANRTKETTNFNRLLHDYDRRPITYYRDTLNAAYPTTSAAYTGSTAGRPVGDLNWFPQFTSVDQPDNVPTSFVLNQNYPNPFNPSTKITFFIEEPNFAVLTVHNVLGQKVATILNKELTAGQHSVDFDGADLSSGVYLYRLESGAFSATKKMILIK
jgi:hypothetical protein